jgi:hypothetical protein
MLTVITGGLSALKEETNSFVIPQPRVNLAIRITRSLHPQQPGHCGVPTRSQTLGILFVWDHHEMSYFDLKRKKSAMRAEVGRGSHPLLRQEGPEDSGNPLNRTGTSSSTPLKGPTQNPGEADPGAW